MGEGEFAGIDDLLPEGGLPLHSIRIVEFLDAQGNHGLKFKVDGDVQLSGTIGVLEMVKHSYLMQHYEEEEG